MPQTGTLRSWSDDRGFGFIAPNDGGPEVFVHISALPRDGTRPTVGEKVTFELAKGRDGRIQATDVVRLAIGRDGPSRRASTTRRRSRTNWLGTLMLLLAVGSVGAYGYNRFQQGQKLRALASQPATTPAEVAAPPADGAYRCDGRTHCSQMTSCAEAKWFISNCPGTRMDGNNDGVPCEQQWCTGLFSK